MGLSVRRIQPLINAFMLLISMPLFILQKWGQNEKVITWAILNTPIIQVLVDLGEAWINWSRHFLYDFICRTGIFFVECSRHFTFTLLSLYLFVHQLKAKVISRHNRNESNAVQLRTIQSFQFTAVPCSQLIEFILTESTSQTYMISVHLKRNNLIKEPTKLH